jgi:hypothetical protein
MDPGSMALAMQLEMDLADLRGRIAALQAEEHKVAQRLAEEYAAAMETAARRKSTSRVSCW